MTLSSRIASGLLALFLAAPVPAAAQSLLGAGGLGVPVSAVGARGRALGNNGIGLSGAYVVPSDPAAAADLRVPAITFTLQQSWVDLESEVAEPTASGTRFPVIAVAYPVRDVGMATISFGSVLDQRWDARLEQVVDLGSENARVTDSFSSDGGVSAIRIGFAKRIAPSLAVGINVGRYLGDVRRVFTRSFDSLAVESNVPDYTVGGRWRFSAPTVTGGAQVDVGSFLRVAGSVTWTGSLEAEPGEGTEGPARSFDVPMELRFGATGVLAPGLQLSTSLAYADWSGTGEGEFEGGGGVSTLDFGAGLEWENGSFLGRRAPLRLGFRRSEYPFRFDAEEATESAWSAGLGLNLAESGPVALARVDFGLERGDRSAGALTESFWRLSMSLQVAGF